VRSFADAIVILWGWRRLLVAILAGAASALAFAPFFAFPILWLTFPVLVLLIDGAIPSPGAGFMRRLAPAFLLGWAFGFGLFLAGLWWIGVAFLVDAPSFGWLMPFAVVILPAGLALFWGFGAALARLLWSDGWPRVIAFAVAIAIAEWLRGHLFTGFPWNAVGYALTPLPLMMQSASLVGVWGLTLLAFFVFAAPVILIDGTRVGRGGRIVLASALVLLAAHVGFGVLRLLSGPDPSVPGVAFRIVQPAIPQDERWQAQKADEAMQRYLDLSGGGKGAAGLAGITHVVWPESAFPFLLTERPDALSAIADLIPPGTTLITGAARAERQPGDARPLIFNSIYVLDDGGEVVAAYDKVHLVPFGEYLPFRDVLSWLGLRQLIALPGGFAPGARLHTLDVPGAPPAAPLICYEVIFPGDVIEPGTRPGWLLNVTNDAWYGDTPGPYQHFLQARVRAVEEGLPLVRAANSGISAIVDPHGRIVASLALGQTGVVDGTLPAALSPTVYAVWGDTIFIVTTMACLSLVIFTKVKFSI
jgi:apolipoprotein N-acyltransferase